ncbi:SnoaL-like polyketide cyclase [Colletotrichum sojae]|uniref:SnoaL-like polyketide cyclase n=1 Tax=Colletotrichum sojae TaxID=2175907 RepID=A0A8H6JKE4_9PEZI|nr:SnoaL-like polyketide cyclase [Colletotrichum sojae]
MATITLQESEAPCFPHEAFLTAPPQIKSPEKTTKHKSPSPRRRARNGDGNGIQVDIATRLREYVDCLNNRRWDAMGNHLADNLIRNSHSQTRDEHIDRLRSRTDVFAGFSVKIDTMLVDRQARAVAARYVNRMTLTDAMMSVDPVGRALEFDEQCFVWFDDRGKIARIRTLQDNDGIRAQQATAAVTPRFLMRTLPDELVDLRALYRDYVAAMNGRGGEQELRRFCGPRVRHNDRPLSLADYARSMQMSHEAIAGLHFEIQELLVDDETQQVAARLQITGTPVSEFAGVRPNGKSVKFHEHCMYRFDRGRISVVWATMELDSFRLQLEAETGRRKSSTLGIN